MNSPQDLETLKKLNDATDCMEFVKILGLEFPVYPDALDIEKFIKFDWAKFKAYEFTDDAVCKLLYWTRYLDQYRSKASVPAKAQKFNVETMLEKATTSREFNKLIKDLKRPTAQKMNEANSDELGIFSAVYLGKDEVIQSMIAKDPTIVNKQNRYGWTPLHFVMCIGCSDAATILVEKGADPMIADREKVLPMVLGAKWGHRATVNNVCHTLLTMKGEKYVKDLLKITDDQQRHPLHYAAESKQHVVCDVLLGFGADPDFPDCNGQTPTFLACKSGNLDTIKVLHIKWSGNIRFPDKKKRTPYDVFPKEKKLLEQLKLADSELE